MKSQWIELKETAITLRQSGQSIKTIHNNLGIPTSTLSGWLKNVELSDKLKEQLLVNKQDAWKRAHQKASEWHRTQKALRALKSKQEAQKIIDSLQISEEVMDVALAIQLFGNGVRGENTPVSSSNPATLRFILNALHHNYGLDLSTIRCSLSIRADQEANRLKDFWAKELSISPSQFKSVATDTRTTGKPTNDSYQGVCVIRFNSVAIRRKLRYLYTLFCERIAEVNLGT